MAKSAGSTFNSGRSCPDDIQLWAYGRGFHKDACRCVSKGDITRQIGCSWPASSSVSLATWIGPPLITDAVEFCCRLSNQLATCLARKQLWWGKNLMSELTLSGSHSG